MAKQQDNDATVLFSEEQARIVNHVSDCVRRYNVTVDELFSVIQWFAWVKGEYNITIGHVQDAFDAWLGNLQQGPGAAGRKP